jgi:hypothetical protein
MRISIVRRSDSHHLESVTVNDTLPTDLTLGTAMGIDDRLEVAKCLRMG